MLKALLAAGSKPNARDQWGQISLHWAAADSDSPEVVKVLLDAGANCRAKDTEGMLPVELIPGNFPLRGTNVYWRLNDARY